jgi:hypothetical protein
VNLVPAQYREVSVTEVPVELDEGTLRGFLASRPVYRRTRYIIARHGAASAVAEVSKESEQPLFCPVTALEQAPGARCVIVRGRYGHVSFILDPAPVRVRVLEVVPPWPPKLVDQLRRVLDLAEDLPPVELVPELIDLRDLAARRPASHYLFPCRAGQAGPAGHDLQVSYLDEIPEREPWTLVGCARSRAIHDWFYGDDVPQVDMCPRNLADNAGPLLTKCCLLEDRVASDGDTVVVPWGASLTQIKEGLRLAVAARAVR